MLDAQRRPARGLIDSGPLVAVALWGGIYPAAKLALTHIPFLGFTGLRVVLAAVLLAIITGRGFGSRLAGADRRASSALVWPRRPFSSCSWRE
jgi:drug/metabolite transporter (DMT)-like permease